MILYAFTGHPSCWRCCTGSSGDSQNSMEASSLSRNRGESLGTGQSIRMGDSVLRRSVFGRTAAADMGEIAQTARRRTNPRVFAGVYRGTMDSAVNSRIRLQE